MDSMQAEQLSILKGNLSKFKRQRSQLLSQLRALHVDQGLGKKGFKKNYDDLLHFFPEVDLKKSRQLRDFISN